jgi:hypothetical protein
MKTVMCKENQDAAVIIGVATLCALVMSFVAACAPEPANAQIRPRIEGEPRPAPTHARTEIVKMQSVADASRANDTEGAPRG